MNAQDARESNQVEETKQSLEVDGLILLDRKEEEFFVGKKKKGKKAEKNKRPVNISHNITTVSQFYQIGVTPPNSLNAIQQAIEQIVQKKVLGVSFSKNFFKESA